MPVSPVAVALISFIVVIAALTGAYFLQCALARLAKAKHRAA